MKYALTCLLSVAIVQPLFLAAAEQAAPTCEFTCKLDKPGLTTAGIFDAQGHLVRVLWTMKESPAGPLDAKWDGKDAEGVTAPAGDYTWKVVANRSKYNNVGAVGNTGLPPTTTGHVPIFLESVATDAQGGVYTVHDWDEAHYDIIKWSPRDGQSEFNTGHIIHDGLLKGIAVEPDGSYAYVSGYAEIENRAKARISIWRVKLTGEKEARKGEVAPFTKAGRCIKVYDGGAEYPAGATQQDKDLMVTAVVSLALRGDTLYANDALKGRVLLYDKASGELKREIPVPLAFGLAVDPAGRIWVGHEHTKVSVYDADGKLLGTPISDLTEVRALALHGNSLYVADKTAAQVRVYAVDGGAASTGVKTTLTKTFGQPLRAGDRAADRLMNIYGMTVDTAGNVLITDRPGLGGRVQKFSPDFKPLWRQFCMEFSSTGAYGAADPDVLISAYKNVYRLDRKNAAWELLSVGRIDTDKVYYGNFGTAGNGPPRVVRIGGNDFFYLSAGDGVVVYRVEPAQDASRGPVLNMVAALGGCHPLPDGTNAKEGWRPENRFLWQWHYEKGEHELRQSDITIVGSPGKPKDWEWPRSSLSADDKGCLWIASYCRRLAPKEAPVREGPAIYALPLGGTDKQGNPSYDWNSAVCVVNEQAGQAAMHIGKEVEMNFKVAGHSTDGMLYALCYTKKAGTPQDKGMHMGGNVLMGFRQKSADSLDSIPAAAWSVVLPRTSVGLCPISGGNGGVLIGCHPTRGGVAHYTKDGLLIGTFQSDPRLGVEPKDVPTGQLDEHLGVCCNRDPRDGLLDVFTEDNYNQRLIWYRVDDRDIQTVEGKLTVR